MANAFIKKRKIYKFDFNVKYKHIRPTLTKIKLITNNRQFQQEIRNKTKFHFSHNVNRNFNNSIKSVMKPRYDHNHIRALKFFFYDGAVS